MLVTEAAGPNGVTTEYASALPKSDIPIITTIANFRTWRDNAFKQGKTVGFVPTMGALHDGHMSLVHESLRETDLTVVSIYINPAQVAPHENIAAYPRTLDHDVHLLSTARKPVTLFLPSTNEMYPAGLSHSEPISTYVVPPPVLTSQMEGQSRPIFFRGVATVVSKLLNITLPTRVYFGAKDIQQALLMKHMIRELCPPTRVRIVRTVREDQVGLALSSRNAWLCGVEREVAGALKCALEEVEKAWWGGMACSDALWVGKRYVDEVRRVNEGKVEIRLDYIGMNDPRTFEPLDEDVKRSASPGLGVILSGALWVGKTRLIDNVLLGEVDWIFE
ncbi:pantoate--beta-alanine ligase [Rhizoctonia solani]|uniref:Pantoate--beta-alanine ligase n=1 Tax=Rhizoctonia solani TaxID=456999 RepID=A0A0K6G8A6_9AGAM|nr:pantoate--beta-alanine ligase [Rhizoctonia solani]